MNTHTTLDCDTKVAVVSAPGKMLLAGGYLVLDEENVGLVVGVNARFYAECRVMWKPDRTALNANDSAPSSSTATTTKVTVISPQFASEWRYVWNSRYCTLRPAHSSDDKNPFVEKAVRVALLFLNAPCTNSTAIESVTLTIAADNDFYGLVPHLRSRGWPQTLQAAQELPLRLAAAKDPNTGEIYKTGLGSSACLVTAVTGCLVHAFASFVTSTAPVSTTETSIARLAQIAHCYAQGKIGSGFDVSAAVYGSHVYQRFSAHEVSELLTLLEDEDDPTAAAAALHRTVNDAFWSGGIQAEVHSFGNHTFLQVLMADVTGGSESPSMARRVLEWKSSQVNSEAAPHWGDLVRINRRIVDLLQEIHVLAPTFDTDLQQPFVDCSDWSTLETPLALLLHDLKQSFQEARRHLKSMGDAAGVPIEPDTQTALCDACCEIPGVVAALVPGAGGYDAVSCIYINLPSVQLSIAKLWTEWQETSVCALTVRGVMFGDGMRVEPEFPSVAAVTTSYK